MTDRVLRVLRVDRDHDRRGCARRDPSDRLALAVCCFLRDCPRWFQFAFSLPFKFWLGLGRSRGLSCSVHFARPSLLSSLMPVFLRVRGCLQASVVPVFFGLRLKALRVPPTPGPFSLKTTQAWLRHTPPPTTTPCCLEQASLALQDCQCDYLVHPTMASPSPMIDHRPPGRPLISPSYHERAALIRLLC